MQIQNYLLIFSVALIILGLLFFLLSPNLRKDSFRLQGGEQLKQEIKELSKPLIERYADEIATGQAIFIKGKNKDKTNWSVKDVLSAIKILALGLFIIVAVIYFAENINKCYFNEYVSLDLIALIVSYVIMPSFILYPKGLDIVSSISRGRRTGWDGDIHQEYDKDTIIFRYSKRTELEYILRFFLLMVIASFLLVGGVYLIKMQFSLETLNFIEANRLAYQECLNRLD